MSNNVSQRGRGAVLKNKRKKTQKTLTSQVFKKMVRIKNVGGEGGVEYVEQDDENIMKNLQVVEFSRE
jgi:hypothetical protein